MSTLDCAPHDTCIEQRCRPQRTSAAGEILAASAGIHARQNQHTAAIRDYGAAVDAYRKANTAVPADLLCALASASIRAAATREARELAAQQADQCLRAAPPGTSERATTVQLLAGLRAEGLDPSHFDEERPATVFFTAAADKPKSDTIEIDIDLPERDTPGFADLVTAVRAPAARDAVSNCFIADWERRRDSRAEAALTIKLTSRMRDMGDYDAFETTLNVTLNTPAAHAEFGECVARGLQTALTPGPKLNRVVAWEEAVRVVAHM